MARSDYYLCDCCTEKTFYDAQVLYDTDRPREDGGYWPNGVGEMLVLCEGCAKDWSVALIPRDIADAARGTE